MTSAGGQSNQGVIFKYDPSNGIYTKQFEFGLTNNVAVNGKNPRGGLIEYGGKLYGMTYSGGSADRGVLFSYDPIGVNGAGNYSKKVDFDVTKGSFPEGDLLLFNNKLYGMTSIGGTNNTGVIFEYNPATNAYLILRHFESTTSHDNGYNPTGRLIMYQNKFYGVTSGGGTGVNGVLFEYDPATGGTGYRRLYSFLGGTADGQAPVGGLMQFGGKLYGMTRHGGSTSGGVIFEYNIGTKKYTKKFDFQKNGSGGSNPREGYLVEYGGKFYGMTFDGGSGNKGVIFKYDPNGLGTYTYKELNFGNTDAAKPSGSLTVFNNKLYGMAFGGGPTNNGVLFEYNPSDDTDSEEFDFTGATGLYLGSGPYGNLAVVDETTLPVTLTSLTAKAEGGHAKIEWATASEQNNDHFEVERSLDGVKFSKIASVAGQGTTSVPQNYSAYDYNPQNGVNYYRLMQVDLNGQATNHGTKPLTFSLNASLAPALEVSPNPATGNHIKFKLSNYKGKEVKAMLTATAGNILHQETIRVNGNAENILNFIPTPGSYILKISGDGSLSLSAVVLVQ